MRTFSGTSIPLAIRSHLSRNRFPCNIQHRRSIVGPIGEFAIVLKGIVELSCGSSRSNQEREWLAILDRLCVMAKYICNNDDGLDVYGMECASIGSLRLCVRVWSDFYLWFTDPRNLWIGLKNPHTIFMRKTFSVNLNLWYVAVVSLIKFWIRRKVSV